MSRIWRGGIEMPGKKPKERDRYVLRVMDGSLVEVSREVYLEWYQSKRRERYQEERDHKYGVYSLNELEEKDDICIMLGNMRGGIDEIILKNSCWDKVRETLKQLSTEEARLIEMLYFMEKTVTETAHVCGCSRKTIQNRRKRILDKLCCLIQKEGICSGDL